MMADAPVRNDVPRAMGGSPPMPASTATPAPDLSGEPWDTPPIDAPMLEPPVPAEVIAPIAGEAVPVMVATGTAPTMRDAGPRPMIVPVAGVGRSAMRDMFNEGRGDRRHEAIDIDCT